LVTFSIPKNLLSKKSKKPEELFLWGKKVAAFIPKGTVLYLSGELGSGKTLWAKGFVEGVGGNSDEVVSPTYTLLNRYITPNGLVLHLDLYRISSEEEVTTLDLEPPHPDEYLLIEWPEKGGKLLPPPTLLVSLHIPKEDPKIRLGKIQVFQKESVLR
jgi:tRNA threonylcarbamoyladenosine biosynthesis protein TsaE